MLTKPLYATWQNNTHPSWHKDPGLKKVAYYCFVLYFAVFASGYDGSYLSGLQALESWNAYFDTPSGNKLGLISASAYLPSFLTVPIISWACDRFGRRPVIFAGATGIIIGAIIGCFANGLAMLIVGRLIVGGSSNFLSVSSVCLLNELVHPRMRHIAVALFLTTYYVGSIVAAWVTFGCVYWTSNWGWRVPTLLQAVGPAFMLANILFMPESPRWLKANGRHEEARVILEKLHSNGQTNDELVDNEIAEIDTSLALESANSTTWGSLLATPGNRKRMVVLVVVALGSQWSGLGLISYYLAPVLRTVGITESAPIAAINGGLSIWNWIAAIAGACLVERAGRRPIWLVSTASMLILWSIFTALNATFAKSGGSGVGAAVIAFIYLFASAYSCAWTPLSFSYTSEILPFRLRAKGMAFFAFVQAVCTCINQWVNPIALEAIEWKYYTVYIVLLAFYLVMVYLYFVETKGYTSEETAALFDGKADEVIAHVLENPTTPGVDDKLSGKGSKTEFIENA